MIMPHKDDTGSAESWVRCWKYSWIIYIAPTKIKLFLKSQFKKERKSLKVTRTCLEEHDIEELTNKGTCTESMLDSYDGNNFILKEGIKYT